ncbi:S8 family serine peptidase [Massilia sp. MB5]|uniref:S8 family serine peptidase n=1 Tax=Massilia sp. MB5 TaxID=2919578 RepID=UPI001F0E5536|nr:S8 family serine peptidase [Massilia sp. MB5]UMR29676.1 S8 family serine peptidase [Massilia sp. MB5]
MSLRKRYIIAVPQHVRLGSGLSLQDVVAGLPPQQLGRSGTTGTQVVEMSAVEADQLARANSDMLIEEDQPLTLLAPMPALGFEVGPDRGQEYRFAVRDAQTGAPVADATLFVKGTRATYRGRTGKDGSASVRVLDAAIEHVIVSPAANYWARVIAAPAPEQTTEVALTPLIARGGAAWERQWLGKTGEVAGGAGVKVALLDSGIAEHPDLAVAGGLNALDGARSNDYRSDEDGHGTHCAGLIGGRNAVNGVCGVAPEAELYAVKAFPGGRLSDLLEGLQWCIDNGMDVVNLSLAIERPSPLLALKLAEAAQAGITLVAAAGNGGDNQLSYPAASEGVLAVTAFGSMHAFPADSAHALRIAELRNDASSLFVPNFSNRGPQAAFIAPGVAIISSVPGGYAAWDGTSMACAFVSGLAALALAVHPEIRTGDARQGAHVRQLLAAAAIDLSLPSAIQGAGVPQAARPAARPAGWTDASGLAQQQQQRVAALISDLEGKQQEIRAMIAQLG